MITKTGKGIIAKYLLGQTQSYASYIALGCGPIPSHKKEVDIFEIQISNNLATVLTYAPHNFSVGQVVKITNTITGINGTYSIVQIGYTEPNNTNLPDYPSFSFLINQQSTSLWQSSGLTNRAIASVNIDYSDAKSLSFEMFRIPIIGRSSKTDEDGITTISLLAELPSQNIYNISELGIFPGSSNPSAGSQSSKMIFSFNQTENWEYHQTGNDPSETVLLPITTLLDSVTSNTIDDSFTVGGISGVSKVFATTINNPMFSNADRITRYETLRNANTAILMRGDSNTSSPSAHIHLNDLDLSYLAGTSEDNNEFRLAFSIINKVGAANGNKNIFVSQPGKAVVNVEFATGETAIGNTQSESATFTTTIDLNGTNNFSKNRYYVVSSKLSSLVKNTPTFSWNNVKFAKVSVEVYGTKYIGPIDGSLLTGTIADLTPYPLAGRYYGSVNIVGANTFGLVKGQTFYAFNDNGRLGTGSVRIEEIYANSLSISSTSTLKTGLISQMYAVNTTTSDQFYIGLDGFRFENILADDPLTGNPLYGLTAYSPVSFNNKKLLFKNSNTKNYVEFDFKLGILNANTSGSNKGGIF
jgi:hypothetical protein